MQIPLGLGDRAIPYIMIEIEPEFMKIIEHMKIDWYQVDGRRIFEVRDNNSKPTGKYAAYLIFTLP